MLIDITKKLEKGIYVYPGDPEFSSNRICDTANGDVCTVTELSFGTHTGTHIDVPAHFITGGRTIGSYSLDELCGKAVIIETSSPIITKDDIGDIEEGLILLFKTPCSSDSSLPNAVMTAEAAEYAVKRKVRLIGIDCMSADDMSDDGFPVHRILLGAGIPILENLDLSNAPSGECRLLCFPLKITGAEAAPVRAAIEII